LSVTVDGTSVLVLSAPHRAAPVFIEGTHSAGHSGASFKGVGQVKDYTEVSLRLGASVIDRNRCFDTVVEQYRQLSAAVDEFNQANLTVESCSKDYTAFESYYSSRSSSIPKTMARVRDAMLAKLAASYSSQRA
jgi:hypothetical protein